MYTSATVLHVRVVMKAVHSGRPDRAAPLVGHRAVTVKPG